MNFITRLLTRFGSAGSEGSEGSEGSIKETESGPKPTKLTDLPTELVLMILDYVSPADAACLTLCNHHFLRVPGTQSWTALDSGLRELFLTRLTSDLPFHFFCHFCSVIHSCKDMPPPGPAYLLYKHPARHTGEITVRYNLLDLVCVHEVSCWYHFDFFHLQLAMKRYYNGPPHGLSTESLSYTQVEVSAMSSVTTLLSIEGRICQGPSLCMRFQNWALLNAATPDEFLSKIYFIFICTHITMYSHRSYIPQLFAAALEGPRTNDNGIHMDPEVHRCRCGVEYQIEVRNYGDAGLALVITKWVDLGPGLRPTDAEWSGHFYPEQTEQLLAGKSVGDTRSLFEREPGLSLESLTWKNKSCLLTESYKKSMDQLDNRTWILQGPRGPC